MMVAREQRNPDWNWIKRDKRSIVKTRRFASPTFHRWQSHTFISIALLRLFPFFFSTSWREERPPLFMGTSDSSRNPCLPFAIGSTETNDRSSLPCFTSPPSDQRRVTLHPESTRYNSDSESTRWINPTLSGQIYIYIFARLIANMVWTMITWGGPCIYASRFYTYRLRRLPLGPIHGLGIREIRTQLANCCPRIRRWNSIERNAITVFLPGREGMEARGEEIRFRDPRTRFDTRRDTTCSLVTFVIPSYEFFNVTNKIATGHDNLSWKNRKMWILNFELAFKLEDLLEGYKKKRKEEKKFVLYT